MTEKDIAETKAIAETAVDRAESAVKAIDWGTDSRPYDMLQQLRSALAGEVELFSRDWDALRASRLSNELESDGKDETPEYAASRNLHAAYSEVDDYIYEMRQQSLAD